MGFFSLKESLEVTFTTQLNHLLDVFSCLR